jgi:hypothetical protein
MEFPKRPYNQSFFHQFMRVHYDTLGAMELLDQYKYLNAFQSLVSAFYILLKASSGLHFVNEISFKTFVQF